jgi:hypothetical protein
MAIINFYKPTPQELIDIQALNESRENVLLIICDHGNGHIGVDADALDHPDFAAYKAECDLVGGELKPELVVILDIDADGLAVEV